jgi:hypothetical protein
MLTLLQLKSSLRHIALFPKKFILDVTIRAGVIGVEGEFHYLMFIKSCLVELDILYKLYNCLLEAILLYYSWDLLYGF